MSIARSCTAFGSRLSTVLIRRNRYITKAYPLTKAGSITSIQIIYAPADDLTGPYKATTFVYFDKTILFNP